MSVASRRDQAVILTERYLACLAGDWPTVALLLLQAPFIGWLCTLVWGSVETDTPSLRFVLCLAAVWLGCIAACREVVRERAILARERAFGLDLAAYVASKAVVLGALGLGQCALLLGAVQWRLDVAGPLPLHLLTLWLTSLTGIGLGLLVSALSRSQERAVGAVPLLILPQILFSEIALPERATSALVERVAMGMPVHWGYEVFQEAAQVGPRWGWTAGALLVLVGMGAALLAATVGALALRRG